MRMRHWFIELVLSSYFIRIQQANVLAKTANTAKRMYIIDDRGLLYACYHLHWLYCSALTMKSNSGFCTTNSALRIT
jgi:hypothetical protein